MESKRRPHNKLYHVKELHKNSRYKIINGKSIIIVKKRAEHQFVRPKNIKGKLVYLSSKHSYHKVSKTRVKIRLYTPKQVGQIRLYTPKQASKIKFYTPKQVGQITLHSQTSRYTDYTGW